MADDSEDPGPETVGYGKPPKAHQFKPGQSGNPKGRPRGPGSLLKAITKHAGKKVPVVENGVAKKMAKLDVVLSALFGKAAKGDVPAARLLTGLVQAAATLESEGLQTDYSDEDLKAILAEADWQAKIARLRQDAESPEVPDGA